MSERPSIHPTALVEGASIGEGTAIGAYTTVAGTASIGARCRVGVRVSVGEGAILEDEVVVDAGCQIPRGARLERGAVLGANATLAAGARGEPAEPIVVRLGATVGANATLLPGVTVGPHAAVGAGAVVTRDVPPHAVVVGNPARIVRYTGDQERRSMPPAAKGEGSPGEVRVAGVRLLEAPVFHDLRGNLTVREVANGSLPFAPQRIFLVFDVPSEEVRGEHAHRELEQLLVCVRGAISVVADDGTRRQEWRLHSPNVALYLPPMVWGIQYKPTRDAVLLVLASDRYRPEDYIRDYDEFMELVRARG